MELSVTILAMCLLAVGFCITGCATPARDVPRIPQIAGKPWTVAHDPDLGPLTSPKQQPVDFSIWQAADGTWQLWSCIRGTNCEGKTRLLHRWQGRDITQPDWTPMGIAMQADPSLGETPGGLQAPHVIRHDGRFWMFYGDWVHICLATSQDGITFKREIGLDGRTAMFAEGPDDNTRDPMVTRIGDRWYCYYTAFPNDRGAVYARTSTDLRTWSDAKIVAFGGRAGEGRYASECPHVVTLDGYHYLFRTQHYGTEEQTSVYRSKDPLDFGINDDRCFVCTLPIAAPEIVFAGGRMYIAWLLPSLKGIQVARLEWTPA